MASVLFLAPADLGETVLATGAVEHILNKGRLVVACNEEAHPLFRAAPGLVAMHDLPDRPALSQLWDVSRRLGRTHFDVVVDARGGLLGRAAHAARRIALKPAQRPRHRVEDWAEAVAAERVLAPRLWIDERARNGAADAVQGSGPLLAIAPGGAEASKRWRPERFAAVARRLANGPLPGACIVVLGAAARDADATRAIVSSLDADGVAARDLGAGLDLLAAAALMERATLALGNDNALTHIAAAVGAPTLTLFGPTDERVRGPCGPRTRNLRGRSLEDIAASPDLDAGAAMDDVSIDAVEAAALELLHAGGLR